MTPSAGFWSTDFTPIRRFSAWKTHPFWPHIPNMTQYGSAPGTKPIRLRTKLLNLARCILCGWLRDGVGRGVFGFFCTGRVRVVHIWLFIQLFHYVSVNSNWVHPPGQPPGISSKTLPGGSEFDVWKLPGGREFDKGGDFVEIQNETFCPYIGCISDKYRVSQKLLNNGEH